jgi:aquaporin Z
VDGIVRRHWPEYLIEAAALGTFMLSACAFTVLLEHPASPAVAALPNPTLRRALIGAAMGLTAICIIYSPWGRRSGAQMNPSLTLAFYRLGRIHPRDALMYVAAQFVGGVTGVLLASALLGMLLSDTAVNYAVTRPGPRGAGVAFAAELAISFGMMLLVLETAASARWSRYTGVFAGLLVATYITLEAPLSGMSMNPARTFGSAFSAHSYTALWLYFLGPPIGMLLATQVYLRLRGHRRTPCAKLRHDERYRCIFCEYAGPPDAPVPQQSRTMPAHPREPVAAS